MINGTQLKLCTLGREMLCFDPKARVKGRPSDKFNHKIQKRDAGRT